MMTLPTPAKQRQRTFLLVLGGITGVALALRLGVCLQLCPQHYVLEPAAVTDMATYRRIALEIVHGELPSHFYYQPFYYAVFLPAIYKLFGAGPWGPALIQMALGAMTVWLTGLSAAHVFGRRAGLLAAGLLAIARFQIFYVPFLLIAVLQAFWLSLMVYLAIRVWQTRSLARLAGLALVTGAAVLTRGNVILLLPGLLALAGWRWRSRPRQAVAAMALCLVLVYALQVPFAVRNYRHLGRWTGPSSAQDAVLALGNTPEAPPGGLVYPASYQDWMELADRPAATRVPVSRQIIAWIGQSPLQFAELKWRMLLLFWYRMEIPNNISISREGRPSSLLACPPPLLLDFSVIGTLGVFGLLSGFKRRSPLRLYLYYAVGAYCAATVLFYILARFRVPVVPLLCVFGGAGLARAWRCLRRRRHGAGTQRQTRLALLLAAAAAAFLVLDGFTWYQRVLEARVMRLVRPAGVQVQTQRRTLVYDHGPYALGGLAAVPVPADGLVVHKQFILPAVVNPQGVPVLRVPVAMAAGTRFEAALSAGSHSYGTPDLKVDDSGGRQQLVFVLNGMAAEERPTEVALTLRVLSGEMAVLVDSLRWYGRSRYASATAVLPLQAEAAFEIEWLTP